MPTPESGKHSMILEMFLFEFNHYTVLATVLTSVLSVLLLLTATRQLWTLRWTMTRDRDSPLPLPKGSMGWPLFGETFHWLLQGSRFHISRREKHGNVFKTHLLGKPVIRVTGAENIRKILLGEHNLVSTQWPQSTRIILGAHTLVNSVGDLHKQKRKILTKVFSRAALETYVPRLQDVVRAEVAKWCSDPGSINAYTSAKALTFRIAVRVLLGLRIDERRFNYLSKTFEQLMDNLFSLPLDVPFSGLRKGMKARDILHECMEKIIEEKLQKKQTEEHSDIFDYMLGSAKENGYEISMQELKESAVELIFAAHSTTASASTSLILQLLRHPSVAETAKAELETQGLNWGIHRPQCPACKERSSSQAPESKEEPTTNGKHGDWSLRTDTAVQKTLNGNMGAGYCDSEGENFCRHSHYLSLEKLSGLRYLDCVVKEVLRFLPPVSGGYRTVLRTFELQGYQIPKGWSVMYSIRDTHETAAVFERPEMFDPERFGPERDESKAGSRFSFIPFGGGIRSCIGRELAQIILKTLAVELLNTAKWELATATFPKMQTVPIVHPVNGLHLYFSFLDSDARKTTPQE